jgi:hypothetical protein
MEVRRRCFITYEVIQLYVIMFIIDDNLSWISYNNSSVPWNKMIIKSSIDKLDKKEKLKN